MTDWPTGHIPTVADILHAYVRAGYYTSWSICDVCGQWFNDRDPDAHGSVCAQCCASDPPDTSHQRMEDKLLG